MEPEERREVTHLLEFNEHTAAGRMTTEFIAVPETSVVYVDGWFVGVVDEFSGYYHHLDLATGPHRIELVASDYDPLLVAVVVSPGRTTTYRGSLNRP